MFSRPLKVMIILMPVHPSPPKLIEGEKVLLRARSIEHAKDMFELVELNRAHLRSWMPWEATTKSVRDSQRYILHAIGWWEKGSAFDYSLFEKSTGRMIGSFGLHSVSWENKSCAVGFWLCEKAQGQGYISEALKLFENLALEMGFHRLILSCDRQNLRSQRLAQRHHFQLEATLVNHTVVRGEMRDTLQFVKLINPTVPGQITLNLPRGYAIKEVRPDEFRDATANLIEQIFDEKELLLRLRNVLTDQERVKLKALTENFRYPYELHLLLMCEGRVAGWISGYQDSRDSFYMVNSAILPDHRGRGLYSRLLDVTMEKVLEKGFQRIWSRHRMTNNSIIIPKLKRGFQITGTELSDLAGSLIHLTFLKNKTRQKALDFRAGHLKPDPELKEIFRI